MILRFRRTNSTQIASTSSIPIVEHEGTEVNEKYLGKSPSARAMNSSSNTCGGPKNYLCYFCIIFFSVVLTSAVSYIYHNFSSLKEMVR